MKLAIALLLLVMLPERIFAQGGLFQRGNIDDDAFQSYGLLRDGPASVLLNNEIFGTPMGTDDITNQPFDTPIGNGLLIMLAAGAGYATLKTQKQKKENCHEEE